MAGQNDCVDLIDRHVVDRARRGRHDRYQRCAHRLDQRQPEHIGARRKEKSICLQRDDAKPHPGQCAKKPDPTVGGRCVPRAHRVIGRRQ